MQIKRAIDRGLLQSKGNLVMSPNYVAPQPETGCNSVTAVTGAPPTVTPVTDVTPAMSTLLPQPEIKPMAHYDYDCPF